MSFTDQEWKAATVFAYGEGGMMTYALTASGEVLVDATSRRGGPQRLNYCAQVGPADPEKPFGGWADRVKAATACLQCDGWPLDA